MRASKHLLPVALAAGLAACSTAPNPIPAGTDTAWYGNLTTGAKFGAAVGQSVANLQDRLWAEGYGYEGVVGCSSETYNLLSCQPNERYLAFQPLEFGRRGQIYLKVEHERVSQIGWDLKIVPYLDN
jgi:hypothetical protein